MLRQLADEIWFIMSLSNGSSEERRKCQLWYSQPMTTTELKRAEKLAEASQRYARRSLQKSRELGTYLSYLEYKTGKVRRFASVAAITRAAKRSRG